MVLYYFIIIIIFFASADLSTVVPASMLYLSFYVCRLCFFFFLLFVHLSMDSCIVRYVLKDVAETLSIFISCASCSFAALNAALCSMYGKRCTLFFVYGFISTSSEIHHKWSFNDFKMNVWKKMHIQLAYKMQYSLYYMKKAT